MTNTPFTKEQAQEILDDFEDLEGTEYSKGLEIEYIAIGPFDYGTDTRFINERMQHNSIGDYTFDHPGGDYDVYAIFLSHDGETAVKDIRTIAEEKGINYNFPV